MPSRYRFLLTDLLWLVFVWPIQVFGLHWVLAERGLEVTLENMALFGLSWSILILPGWYTGVRIANAFGYTGRKRIGALFLGWLFMHAIPIGIFSVVAVTNSLIFLATNYENARAEAAFWMGVICLFLCVLGISVSIIRYTLNLNRRALEIESTLVRGEQP